MKLIFEWDANKANKNRKKHQIDVEEAKTIFCDPFLITFYDDFHSKREERYISIGYSARQRILLAVHTEQQTEEAVFIRIISSRKATPSERKIYEEKS